MRLLVPAALLAAFFGNAVSAMDTDRYREIVVETIRGLEASPVDTGHLLELQNDLVAIAVDGCREYAENNPDSAEVMQIVIDNADAMIGLSLDQIEEDWHDGGVLMASGVDYDSLDHFGATLGHVEAVVHPATAYIAIEAYMADGDPDHLEQVRDELTEVVEHMDHLH